MTEVSVAYAKNQLTRLIYEAEAGETIHVTRRGKPVAVIISEHLFEQLQKGEAQKNFWKAIQEMRSAPDFEPVDLAEEEISAWRDKSLGREFSWED